MIIDTGRIIFDGPISAIKNRFGRYREITFETPQPVGEFDLPPGAETVNTEPRKLALRFDRTLTTASQVAAAVMSQIEVSDFSLAEPDLASIVKQIYNGALQESAA